MNFINFINFMNFINFINLKYYLFKKNIIPLQLYLYELINEGFQ